MSSINSILIDSLKSLKKKISIWEKKRIEFLIAHFISSLIFCCIEIQFILSYLF